MDPLPPDAPVPRLCHLKKWPESFDGFGFNLQVGHFIGKVDEDSPAQHADLREGDRIIEVNGVCIANENHKQVVQRIKAVPDETNLLVIDRNDYQWYKDRDLVIRSTQSNVVHCYTPVPRPGYSNHTEVDEHQMNGKMVNESTINESTNVSLNTSNNLSIKESTVSIGSKENERQSEASSISDETPPKSIESKENNSTLDELANKLEVTRLQNEAVTIESNNNSEKTANQNLVSPVRKTHNFVVVNSEAHFTTEKREKDDKIRNEEQQNNLQTNSTPIKGDCKGVMNLSTSSVASSINTNSSNMNNNLNSNMNMDNLNLNMTASEMRKLIAQRRNVKAECKNAGINLRQKYEIIQQM